MPPANPRLSALSTNEIFEAIEKAGSITKAAAALGIPKTTFKTHVKNLRDTYRVTQPTPPVPMSPPKKGVRSWIFSSAQAETATHEPFLRNLEAYAKHLGATIHIAGFTYNMSPYDRQRKHKVTLYHPDIEPYITNKPFEIADKLVFCGEMNTLPTAVNPLAGFHTYTRNKWGIFPHPKVMLESIPVRLHDDPKIIMTTGAVTRPNYIQKKAGISASFHHSIGAVLVEMDADGDFFCRHLLADDAGNFCDLDTVVNNGKVKTGKKVVEAVVWGDIHAETLDDNVAFGAWGIDHKSFERYDTAYPPMVDALQPSHQIFHDILDFRRRNHHNIKDPHHWYKMHIEGRESVSDEVQDAALFLEATYRKDCNSVVVDSNHDRALERWIKYGDYRYDPSNAMFFLNAQAACYEHIASKSKRNFLLSEWAIKEHIGLDVPVTFLHQTDSYVICDDIECGMHGDKGANGAKGHIKSFSKMGPKANIADKHGAGIYEGIYLAGHSCERDQGYNQGGLTSWNPSHIVTYKNGKRTIVTMRGSKWRAI